MPGPLAIAAIGFGVKAVGSEISRQSRNKSEERRRQRQLDALKPAEDRLAALTRGPTSSEDALFKATTRRSLSGLAKRGVLDGSTSQAEVAAASAPVENAFQARRDDLGFSLAAAKARIEGDTELTGFGEAFGGTLNDVGSFIALKQGMSAGGGDDASLKNSFDMMKAAGLIDEDAMAAMMKSASMALF